MSAVADPLLARRFANLAASLLLIAGIGALYALTPYYRDYFAARPPWLGERLSWWDVLLLTATLYVSLLSFYYLFEPAQRTSKSILCLRALRRLASRPLAVLRQGLPREERLGLLSVLLKGFFAPLMVVWLFDHSAQLLAHGRDLWAAWGQADALTLFNAHGFWLLFKLILFFDVFFFTLGYLVELPALKNEIRSVDPTVSGWAVTLACYPPFNALTSQVFGWHSADFPQFDHVGVHLAANAALLTLMAIYSWASLALLFKASNLTHRGIVAHGPYRYVRHPAYVCKNLAWWIGLMPAAHAAAQTSLAALLTVLGSMAAWSAIYYLRAVTEEAHLKGVDGEYAAYCARVRYRFIPGLV
jgi:protein-S-isoprenylcysteine O-methyltransferase Ste14